MNAKLINWADIIFAMETKHREMIQQKFSPSKKIIVLHIPDDYQYMDPELIQSIRTAITPYIDDFEAKSEPSTY